MRRQLRFAGRGGSAVAAQPGTESADIACASCRCLPPRPAPPPPVSARSLGVLHWVPSSQPLLEALMDQVGQRMHVHVHACTCAAGSAANAAFGSRQQLARLCASKCCSLAAPRPLRSIYPGVISVPIPTVLLCLPILLQALERREELTPWLICNMLWGSARVV